MLEEMVKAGQATEHRVGITTAHLQHQFGKAVTDYPRGNDTAGPETRAGFGQGNIDRQVGGHPTEDVVVLDPLSEKVKAQVEAAGGRYTIPRGTATVVDPATMNEVSARVQRLRSSSALGKLARWLGKKAGSASGSISGSASGSASGSSATGDDSEAGSHKQRSDGGAGTESARSRQVGSGSGSVSGETSGSESGELSKALIERFTAGDREAGLQLMGRR
jgi:hypothetical protein